MKRICVFFLIVCMLILTAGCAARTANNEPTAQFLGSYTLQRTYSHDHAFYADQTAEDNMSAISVYRADTNELVDHFLPVRSSDFWGVCWEKDTYSLWIQSADVGNVCYAYNGTAWERQDGCETPDYIISKYDQNYANSADNQKTMYKSPTE